MIARLLEIQKALLMISPSISDLTPHGLQGPHDCAAAQKAATNPATHWMFAQQGTPPAAQQAKYKPNMASHAVQLTQSGQQSCCNV
jgi:hypothetical protein